MEKESESVTSFISSDLTAKELVSFDKAPEKELKKDSNPKTNAELLEFERIINEELSSDEETLSRIEPRRNRQYVLSKFEFEPLKNLSSFGLN